MDANNFDKDFTSEDPVLTPVASVVIKAINQDEFNGFSFVNGDYGRMLDMPQLAAAQLTTQTSVTNATAPPTNTANKPAPTNTPKPATPTPANTPKTVVFNPGTKTLEPLLSQKGGSIDLPTTPSPKIQLSDTPPKLSVASKSLSSSVESNESTKPVSPPVNVTQPLLAVSSPASSASAITINTTITTSSTSTCSPGGQAATTITTTTTATATTTTTTTTSKSSTIDTVIDSP